MDVGLRVVRGPDWKWVSEIIPTHIIYMLTLPTTPLLNHSDNQQDYIVFNI